MKALKLIQGLMTSIFPAPNVGLGAIIANQTATMPAMVVMVHVYILILFC